MTSRRTTSTCTIRSPCCASSPVLHDLDLAAAFADRLIVLDDGHLVAQGPTDEVLTAQLVAERFAVRGQVSRTDRLRFSWQGLVSDGG